MIDNQIAEVPEDEALPMIATKKDMRLLSRAVREQWPTAPEMKQKAIDNLLQIIELGPPDLQLVAIDQLRKIDKHNFDMLKAAQPTANLHLHQHQERPQTENDDRTPDDIRADLLSRTARVNRISGG